MTDFSSGHVVKMIKVLAQKSVDEKCTCTRR
jgi:hypothetical protein